MMKSRNTWPRNETHNPTNTLAVILHPRTAMSSLLLSLSVPFGYWAEPFPPTAGIKPPSATNAESAVGTRADVQCLLMSRAP